MGRAIDLPPHHLFVDNTRLGTLRAAPTRIGRRSCDASGVSLRPKVRPEPSACNGRNF
jgi:hypothetical protein